MKPVFLRPVSFILPWEKEKTNPIEQFLQQQLCINPPIVWMRTSRLRESKWHDKGYAAGKWQSWERTMPVQIFRSMGSKNDLAGFHLLGEEEMVYGKIPFLY